MTSEAVVRFGDQVVPQGRIERDAAVVASALAADGLGGGDRVAILLRNDPAFLALVTACGLCGTVPVPVNWHAGTLELAHMLADSEARLAFVHSDLVAAVEAEAPDLRVVEVPAPDPARVGAVPTGRHPLLADWTAGHGPYTGTHEPAAFTLMYTSGTTGLAKGVVRGAVPPDQARRGARVTLAAMGLKPGMRTLVTAPLYHAAPYAQAVFALRLGIDVTIMPRFDAEGFLQIVQEQRISHAQVVPTMLIRLLALPEETRAKYDTSSLEVIVHAAAPCPESVKRGMIDWVGPIICEYYGGTEVGIVLACDTEQWLAHPGTVGAPIDDAAVCAIDPAGGMLPAGETGELCVRPPSFWAGYSYHGGVERPPDHTPEGYVSLGDVGFVDEDGFVFLSDRGKDLVISGGVNISPAEVERCLVDLRGVRDVAVFGIPDPEFGEVLAAHVDADPEADLTEDAVREHVRARLAAYKVPKLVVFDDNLPREASGKLIKRLIRDRYWQETGRSI